MASNVPHHLPSTQAHAIADLTGYEDDSTLRWQQCCAQVAQRLSALPHGRYAFMTLERVRQGLDLAQRGCVTLAEDLNDLSAVVRSGSARYRVNMGQPSCECADFQKRRMPCKHLLATDIHIGALSLFNTSAPEALPEPDEEGRSAPSARIGGSSLGREELDEAPEQEPDAPMEPEAPMEPAAPTPESAREPRESGARSAEGEPRSVRTGPEPAASGGDTVPTALTTPLPTPAPSSAAWPTSEAPASLNIKLRVGNMELMYTMRDVDDLKVQRRATMALPWLRDILHECEADLERRQQEAARKRQEEEDERKAQTRTLDEQIAAAVAAAMKAQASPRPNGGRQKPPTLPEAEPTSDTDPSWCPIHRCTMERRTNDRGSWWSHRLANGGYCKGE